MTTDSILFPLAGPPSPPSLSLGEVAAMLGRNVVLIGVCVTIVSALTYGLYRLQKPLFVATTRVLVQTDQLGTPSFLSGIAAYRESQIAEPVGRKLETEMALITNRANVARVVTSLGIDEASLSTSPLANLKALAAPVKRWLGRPASQQPQSPDRVVNDFLALLSVEPVRSKTAETTSNVLEISLATTDPALSTRALQGVLDSYLHISTQQNRGLGTETTKLLQSEIARSKKELKTVEDAMVALAVRESAQPEFASSSTTAALGGGQARRDAGRTANETATSQLVMQVLDLQGQLDALRENFTDQTQSVVRLRQRLGEVRGRLTMQMRTSATNSATFNQLERQRVIAQDHYVELRRKLDQIDLYMALTPAALDGRIVVSPPTRPTAENGDGTKTKLPLIAGPVAGLLLGLLLAGLRESLQPRVRTRREVERLLGMPMLGALPSMPRAPRPGH